MGVAGAIAAVSCVAPPAYAQQGDPAAELSPPTPGKIDKPPTVWNYLTMILIVAAVVGANLIPSKRGHQD